MRVIKKKKIIKSQSQRKLKPATSVIRNSILTRMTIVTTNLVNFPCALTVQNFTDFTQINHTIKHVRILNALKPEIFPIQPFS